MPPEVTFPDSFFSTEKWRVFNHHGTCCEAKVSKNDSVDKSASFIANVDARAWLKRLTVIKSMGKRVRTQAHASKEEQETSPFTLTTSKIDEGKQRRKNPDKLSIRSSPKKKGFFSPLGTEFLAFYFAIKSVESLAVFTYSIHETVSLCWWRERRKFRRENFPAMEWGKTFFR